MNDVSKLYSVTDSMGTFLMKVLREEITNLRTMWAVTPAQQQQEILDRMADHVDSAVKMGARKIIAAGIPSITATLQQITVKDGVKATLIFDKAEDALDALTHRVGSSVVLVLADPEAYAEGVDQLEADADQNSLPLGE